MRKMHGFHTDWFWIMEAYLQSNHLKLSHIPSTSLNFSIVTFKAPLFRKEVIGWKEAIASRRLGTKKVDVLKKLSTTAELEKYSSNDYISYKNFEGLFRYCFLCTLDFPLTKSIDNMSATTSFSLKSFLSLCPIYNMQNIYLIAFTLSWVIDDAFVLSFCIWLVLFVCLLPGPFLNIIRKKKIK